MPQELFFKVGGRIKNNGSGYDEEFLMFVKGLDQNHAVMIARETLRNNAPTLEGKLPGSVIIESIEEKFAK